jgi:hypothetical protein
MDGTHLPRRRFFAQSLGLATAALATGGVVREPGVMLRLALNAFAFD